MPLNSSSPTRLHLLQNLSLIAIAINLLPLLTFITLTSILLSPFTNISKHIAHTRKWRTLSSATFRPRTILVTGVGMSKGLFLARTFHASGHNVIGADFEPHYIPVCGHFSRAISKFFRVTKPIPEESSHEKGEEKGSAQYVQDLIDIIKREKVELWVSCSGVASALDDGEAAEAIERETNCRVVQFGYSLTETLHTKHSFIAHTRKIGLNVPSTHLVTSETEAHVVLYPSKDAKPRCSPGTQYIMKSVGLDDSIRADMTLLPRPTLKETGAHLRRMNPTPFRPFVLQQYISGSEYCTHSLIINGVVKAFVACPSAELLMHYTPLPASSALSQAMLLYTRLYAERTEPKMTGHFSIDFLVEAGVAETAEGTVGVSEDEVKELMGKLYPIECNPRAHTAIVAFRDVMEDLSAAYLSVLPAHEPKGISNGHRAEALVVPKPGIPGTYWIGHDFVTKVLLPVLWLLRGRDSGGMEVGMMEVLQQWVEFLEHVLWWRDGTWEIWDPWPLWVLYAVYWPGMFAVALWERRWWSRCNVSTTKMFGC